MRLGLIVAKLIAASTRFEDRIGGAAELELAWDATLKKDTAFVVPLSEGASPNTGDVVIKQKLTERFSVVVAIANDSSDKDKVGFAAYDSLHAVRAELWSALLGWVMPDVEDMVSYVGGRISKIHRGYLWFQFDFECSRWVGKDDGVTEEATDYLDQIWAQYQVIGGNE